MGSPPGASGCRVRPIITDFSTRFFAFGSWFAQNTTDVLARLGWSAFFDRAVVTHYSSRTLRALLERWLQESPYREDELYRFRGQPELLLALPSRARRAGAGRGGAPPA